MRPQATMALGVLALAGGFAAPPRRPTPSPVAAGHLPRFLAGCSTRAPTDLGYTLECGGLSAMVWRADRDIDLDTLRSREIHMLVQAVGRIERVTRRSVTRRLGARRQMIAFTAYAKGDATIPRLTGLVATWPPGPERRLTAACAVTDTRSLGRCLKIIDWLAIHPTAPAALPRRRAWAAAASWPPRHLLDGLTGCTIVRIHPAEAWLDCSGTQVGFEQVTSGDTAIAREDATTALKMAAEEQFQNLKRDVSPRTTLTEVRCRVGGETGDCERILVPAGHGSTGVLMGLDHVSGAFAILSCIHEGLDGPLPAVCRRFIRRAPGPAGARPGRAAKR